MPQFIFSLFLFHLLLFSVIANESNDSNNSAEEDKPDQIIELFRHGARGPLAAYDPTWPLDEWGVLTSVGMRQQYILGEVLREKYSHIFDSEYDYDKIYIISDVTPRCIQSATTQLYGIYHNKGDALRPDYPKLTAIPPFQDKRVKSIANSLPNTEATLHKFLPNIVNIVDSINAVIFQGDQANYCPNMMVWEKQNINDSKAKEAWKIFETTINNINKHLNESQKLTTVPELIDFGDTMLVDLYDNRTIPGGIIDEDVFGNFTHAFTWFVYHAWEGQLIQRQLAAFAWVDEVLNQMSYFRAGSVYKKAALYSGHDDNLMAVLAAFGVITEECLMENFQSYVKNKTIVHPNCYFPYFASNIIIEFYNKTDSPYVKFFYNNVQIPLCNGSYNCSYDQFVIFAKKATGDNTYKSYSQKCGAKERPEGLDVVVSSANQKILGDLDTELKSMALVLVTLLCGLLSVKIMFDKRKYHELTTRLEENRSMYFSMRDNEAS